MATKRFLSRKEAALAFIKNHTGETISVPWGWPGECVSLAQIYINEIYGQPLYRNKDKDEVWARGNGVDFGNTLIAEGVAKEVDTAEFGDLLIWGGFDGYGHVGIRTEKGYVFDQTTGVRKTAQIREQLPNVKQIIRMTVPVIVYEETQETGQNKPAFKPYNHNIPAKSTLYTRSGVAEQIKTTNSHDVTILEEVYSGGNKLGRFKADWLVGRSESYVLLSKKQSNQNGSKPNRVGSNVTIKAGAVLYDDAGNQHSIKTTTKHQVVVSEQKGTRMKFKAKWLIGVNHAWVDETGLV